MKPLTIALYALLVAVLLAVPARADVCHAPAVQVYPAQAVYPFAVPLYGASYSGGDPETAELLRALIEEIRGLRSEVAGLKGGPQALASPKGPDPVVVMTKNCAACHTPGPNLKGEYAMFDTAGKLLLPSPPERRAIEKRVREGTMPPPTQPKLGPEDRAAIVGFATAPPAPTPAKLPAAKK